MPKLLLFDIDGTLLVTRGTGRKAMRRGLGEHFGQTISTDGMVFSGKTDPQILRELLVMNGLIPEDAPRTPEADALVEEAITAYVRYAEPGLAEGNVTALEGTTELLDALAEDERVTLGLLTGNVEHMAWAKLRHVGLDGYFSFGAFGSDDEDRRGLPLIAVERAAQHTERVFRGKDVVIIGDTEHDVLCGRELGVCAVAVCTGRYGRDDLAAHDPDHLFDDLCDRAAFVEAVFA